MIVSIHQPGYLPWLGYFHKIALSNIHVFLDNVQFEKNYVDNRNKIKTAQGWVWLTVPVLTKGRSDSLLLNTIEIDNKVDWRKKHWQSILQNYRKAPYFQHYADFFEHVYQKDWKRLIELNQTIIRYLLQGLGIQTEIVSASCLSVKGEKSDLVLNLCQGLQASTYISGIMGKDYLQEDRFTEANINIVYQDYHHPVYQQLYGQFEPYMSIIDLLFNCGPESLEIMMKGNRDEQTA